MDGPRPRHGRKEHRKAQGKQHDWGIQRELEAAGPAEMAEGSPRAPVDVPDALRARIKAMLAAQAGGVRL